jgi:hypothetical protein
LLTIGTIPCVLRRVMVALAAALVIVGLVLVAHFRSHTRTASGSVLLVGDSLNVGIEPYLRESLEHWKITSDDVVGRATSDGIAAVERERRARGPVVISLGTNDDPGDADAFRSRVEQLLELLPSWRCVIWATLWRDGAPETTLNDVLQDVARTRPNVHLLDWAGMLRDHPDWRAPDETHGSPEGYRARAEEVARIARACSADEGPVADAHRPSSENA